MTTQTAHELSARLVRLYTQAGIIDPEDLRKYQSRHKKRKEMVDILRQDVSVETFRDLGHQVRNVLTAEIRLPFGGSQSGGREVGAQLGSVLDIRADELIAMLNAVRPQLDYLILRLAEARVADEKELKDAVAKAERMGENPYEWLVRHELMGPDILQQFLNSPENPLIARCSLFLGLEILQHNGVLSEEEFDTLAQRVYSLRLSQALTDVKKRIGIDSAGLIEKIEAGMYLPGVSLEEAEVERGLIEMFPPTFVRRHLFLPYFRDDHRIGVAIADPLNIELAVFVRWLTGKWMQAHFAPSGTLIDRINEALGPMAVLAGARSPAGRATNGSARTAGASAPAVSGRPAAKPAGGKKSAAGRAAKPARGEAAGAGPKVVRPAEAPVDSLSAVQLVSSLIESAIDLKATDIHLQPGRDSATVRFRIDGLLTRILEIPANMIGPVTSRIKVLANMDVTERRRPQDGHIMLDLEQRHFDFRIATMPTVFGEKVAIRILDSARVMTGLDQLGMTGEQVEIARRLIQRPYGIILVTGPTGSGKTSTLYSALNELNEESRHLVTIEDPVEYQIDGINQIQVDLHIGLTFPEGLRAILRQDPNVIMVGEIRDADTCKTAIRAAMTGHVVFSTLHTNTAIGAIQALGNLGATPYTIGSALAGIISQRLVRKLCPECRKSRVATQALARTLGMPYRAKMRVPKAAGCERCMGTGYAGRIGIFEILEVTEKLRGAILNDEAPDKLLRIADAEGWVSILQAGAEKIKAKMTTPEEVIQKVVLET